MTGRRASTRMLVESRAEHLASHGLTRDVTRERLDARATEAAAERARYEERLAALADERAATHWWRRSERRRPRRPAE